MQFINIIKYHALVHLPEVNDGFLKLKRLCNMFVSYQTVLFSVHLLLARGGLEVHWPVGGLSLEGVQWR